MPSKKRTNPSPSKTDNIPKESNLIQLGNGVITTSLHCKNCNEAFSKNFDLLRHLSTCNDKITSNNPTKKRKTEEFTAEKAKNYQNQNDDDDEIEVLSYYEQSRRRLQDISDRQNKLEQMKTNNIPADLKQAEKTAIVKGNNGLIKVIECSY